MEERVIVLKCWNEKTYVRTDAPRCIIEEAIEYRNEVREDGNFDEMSDFELVQKYAEDRCYTFEECEEDCEEYWW